MREPLSAIWNFIVKLDFFHAPIFMFIYLALIA